MGNRSAYLPSGLELDATLIPSPSDPCRAFLTAFLERVVRDLRSRNSCDWRWFRDALSWCKGRNPDPLAFTLPQIIDALELSYNQITELFLVITKAEDYARERETERLQSRARNGTRINNKRNPISSQDTTVLWPGGYLRYCGSRRVA